MIISKYNLKILEKYFDYMELNDKDNLYLETWTNGGVDMIIYLEDNKSIKENLQQYIKNFDIDEEIDIHRQDEKYKRDFNITESLEYFKNWITYIEKIEKELKG